ncbi:hypothetical protein [Mesorhizobium sp. CO1-1-7]
MNSLLFKTIQPAEPKSRAQEPAVDPKRSVIPDHIGCLEDRKGSSR